MTALQSVNKISNKIKLAVERDNYDLICKTLLSGLDGHGLWLNSAHWSMCGILKSDLSGSQMNSLSGVTACYLAECRSAPAVVGDAGWSTCRCTELAAKCHAEENSEIDHGHQAWTTKFYTMLAVKA